MRRLLLLATSWALLVGCDQALAVRYVDPPITLLGDGGGTGSGDAAFRMGYYVDGTYDELDEGEPCPVVHAIQGGTWTMPSLRTVGMASFANVTCTLVTTDRETLGHASSRTKFFPLVDGPELEAFMYPIQVRREAGVPGEVEDLDGAPGSLSCGVDDGAGTVLQAQAAVVIAVDP